MRLAICALLLVTGCALPDDEPCYDDGAPQPVEYPLSELPGFEIRVAASTNSVGIRLSTLGEYAEPCPRLTSSFVATLDGAPMNIGRGNVADIGVDCPEWGCAPPRLSAAGGRYLHIADDSASYDIDLGDATDERTLQLATTTVTRGETFSASWSPATDLAEGVLTAELYTVKADVSLGATIVGGSIELAMPAPADLPYNGPGTVTVDVRVQRACSAPNCRIDIANRFSQDVTVR